MVPFFCFALAAAPTRIVVRNAATSKPVFNFQTFNGIWHVTREWSGNGNGVPTVELHVPTSQVSFFQIDCPQIPAYKQKQAPKDENFIANGIHWTLHIWEAKASNLPKDPNVLPHSRIIGYGYGLNGAPNKFLINAACDGPKNGAQVQAAVKIIKSIRLGA